MSIYLLLKSLHIIAIIAWMAGLLYLPRIYVYHCQTTFGSEAHEKFVQMEYRLLKYIMNPAMIISWILGIGLIHSLGHEVATQFWLQLKLFLVLLMSGFHGYLGTCRKKFESNTNTKSEKFYRIINEVPTVLMIIIVFLVVFKPI
jgi:protoporphyrinogen IX oxidase